MYLISIDLPSSIQALAAVGLVILTFLTLRVLRVYAADTKDIAKASVKQNENSQMPVLTIFIHQPGPGIPEGWVLKNQGFGPALNIVYTGFSGGNEPIERTLEVLGAGEYRLLHNDIAQVLARWPFEVRYESISGLKYKTTARTGNNGLQTKFHQPPNV